MPLDVFLFFIGHLVVLGAGFLAVLLLVLLAISAGHRVSAGLARRRWPPTRPVIPEVGPCTATTLGGYKSPAGDRDLAP